MAAVSSKKGKKKKGQTLDLSTFLSGGSADAPEGKAVVLVKQATSWADAVEDDDDFYSSPAQQISLPTAPRAARQEIDLSQLPDKPPYTAYVGNLSYDVDEDVLQDFFTKLKLGVNSVRLPNENGRMKGYGYVEFVDKQTLVDALKTDGELLLMRKIKVDLATQSNNRDGGGFGGDSRGGNQISGEGDADDDWRGTAAANKVAMDSSAYGRSGAFNRGRDERDGGGFGSSNDRFGGPSEADTETTWSRGPPRRDERDGGFNRGRDERNGGGFGSSNDRFGGPSEADTETTWSRGPPRSSGFEDRNGSSGPRRGYDERDSGFGGQRRGYDDRESRYGAPRSGYDDRRGDRDYGAPRRGGYDDNYERRDGPPPRYNDYGGGGNDRSYRPHSSYQRHGGGGSEDDYRYRAGGRHGIGNGYTRNDARSEGSEAPKERPRMQLQPRTKPGGPAAPSAKAAPTAGSSSVFGSAKPVDTAAKEREIEERMRKRGQESRPPPRDTRDSFSSRDIRTNVERKVYNAVDSNHSARPNHQEEEQRPATEKPPIAPEPVKKPSSASIFGAAKPVDTAAKEREIEERLRKQKETETSQNDVGSDRRYENSSDRRYESSSDRRYESSSDRRYEGSSDRRYESSSDRRYEGNSDRRYEGSSDRRYEGRDHVEHSREPPRTSAWSKSHPSQQPSRPGANSSRGHGGRTSYREKKERPLPTSIDEMPVYKESESRDFSDKNKFAGLLGSDGDDEGVDD